MRAKFEAQLDKMERDHDKDIVELKAELVLARAETTAVAARVMTIEMQRAGLMGARTFATELRQWAPTIMALAGFAYFYFTHKGT